MFETAFEDAIEKLGIDTESTWLREKLINSNVGYFRIGKGSFYQDVNDTWLKLYKYNSKNEIIGKHYSLSRTKEDFVSLKKSVNRVLNDETIPFSITLHYCKDGRIGYHHITMTPVYEGDEIVGFEGFIVDKTDKKLAEEELKKGQV